MKMLKLSGLEAMSVSSETNFINIGERTNVTGSKAFLRMINEGDFDVNRSELSVAATAPKRNTFSLFRLATF